MMLVPLRSPILTSLGAAFLLLTADMLEAQEIEAAKAIAVRVNDVLSRYVAVHDDLFAFRLRRVTPVPGVFERIDFQAHADTLGALSATLDSLRGEIQPYLKSVDAGRSLHTLLSVLRDYALALNAAVAQLRHIATSLQLKSEDPSVYTWDEYDDDVERYEAAAARYAELGATLNALYKRLP